MALENSTLYKQVLEIASNGALGVHFTVSCEIKANGKTFIPLKVLAISTERNYDENFSDAIVLELAISAGTYSHDIFPYKDNLEIKLHQTPINEVADDENFSTAMRVLPYRAVLIESGSPALEGNHSGMSNKSTADLAQIKTVSIQLIDPLVEQLRMKSVGGVFRGVKAGDVIKTLLGNESKGLQLPADQQVIGVDMISPYNQTVRDHILIPHGTKLCNAPLKIHNEAGGVYPTGLSYYLQNQIWYVFPKFDISRFETTPKTLTVLNIPANKMPGIERTYKKTANRIVVVATGDVKHRDNTETLLLNEGNGVRFADAAKIVGGFGEVIGNKLTLDRSSNNSEFVGEKRSTGLNNVIMSAARITSNAFLEMSKIASKAGSFVDLLWENSDPDLITPGMPVRLLYLIDDEVKELYGLVLRTHTLRAPKQEGMTTKRYVTNTALSLFVGRKLT